MSRSIVLGNGELAIALDSHGLVRDVYYPHVGYEDHVRGHYVHRIGVWVDGVMTWLGEDLAWDIKISCEEDALASSILAKHGGLKVQLNFKDIVYNERPVFLRRVAVHNMSDRAREIKLYFGHQFEIYKSHGGDTAYFDPVAHALIHYKGRRVFLIQASLDGVDFQDYATGLAGFKGHEGTHRDADDGHLSKNPIEHGPADSVIGLYAKYAPGASRTCYYTLLAEKTIPDALKLHKYVVLKTPEHILQTASDYWRAWIGAYDWHFYKLTPEQVALFKRSLFFVRAHVDNGGGIIASLDSDMLQHGLDTYAYVWPRDAAYAAMALDAAGDTNVAKRFFEFCKTVISEEGYFMHKYLPDGALGSSWHPWIKDGQFQLPIQEDETALVLIALARHYEHSRDLEFLEDVFNPLVERAADFMLSYRDPESGLPRASYDLWEEKRGSTTFTAAAVYGALMAAAAVSKILGKDNHEKRYREGAASIARAVIEHLWDEKRGAFCKMLQYGGKSRTLDATIDISSAYGIFTFGVLSVDDPKLTAAFENSVRVLSEGIESGGISRYEGDDYFRSSKDAPSNPWMIATLWYAEYLIARAKTDADLDRVRVIFSWVAKHALPSGVLPEQLNPRTGEPISATPLTWSHAAYVSAVLKYLDRVEEIGLCKDCNPAP